VDFNDEYRPNRRIFRYFGRTFCPRLLSREGRHIRCLRNVGGYL